MPRRAILLVACLSTLLAQSTNTKKPADLELVSITATRHGDQIHVDGTVKNTSAKPLEKVTVILDFFAPNRKPMTSKRGPVDTALLEPGDEASFQLATNDPGQVVAIEVQAVDRRERDLRLSRSGPFSID